MLSLSEREWLPLRRLMRYNQSNQAAAGKLVLPTRTRRASEETEVRASRVGLVYCCSAAALES